MESQHSLDEAKFQSQICECWEIIRWNFLSDRNKGTRRGNCLGESGIKTCPSTTEIVAPTDSTVLILDETGTGKALIAHALHQLSRRGDRAFVKINCAAIPTGLLESELFGPEKGAFTGAIAQKVGRFELAHRGPLSLDEIGEVPLELQSYLLPVLQEQEFERLGGHPRSRWIFDWSRPPTAI